MLTAALVTLLACSEPDAPATPPPPTDGAPVPTDGAPPPADGAVAPPPADGTAPPAGPPPGGENAPPSLASLVAGGASATLTLTLDGAPEANVDFVIDAGDGSPKIVAQEKVKGPTATLTIPAKYDSAVWLSGWYDTQGDGPDPSDFAGVHDKGLTFDGKDLTVTLKLAKNAPPPKVGPFGKPPKEGTTPAGPPPPAGSAMGTPGTVDPATTNPAPQTVEGGAAGAPPAGGNPPGGAPPASNGTPALPK